MSFRKLYEAVAKLNVDRIVVDRDVVPLVKALAGQDDVFFVPVELDRNISLGHIKQYRDGLHGVYTDSRWITEIRYDYRLNLCWRRYVGGKELMHAFDTEDERTNSRAKYFQLMGEIESPKLIPDQSPMMNSETRTKWMALAMLCPLPLRNKYQADWRAKKLSDLEVALRLRIPEAAVKTVMDDYFDQVIGELIQE